MFNAYRQSIKALTANPVRTVLTTLGIVIGIATVILVLSAGAGFRSLVDQQLAAFGTDTLFIETRVPPTTKSRASGSSAASADFSRATTTVQITSFKTSDLDIIKKLNNVEGAYGLATGQAVISYRENAKSIIYYGAGAEMFSIDKHTLKSGRFFTEAEDTGAAQVVLLGTNLADDLFGQDDPIGKLVKVGNLNFQVIGVYNPQGALSGGADDMLYMPLDTAQKKMLGINYIIVGVVQVKDIDAAEATAENIRGTMRSLHRITDPEKDDFTVTTQAEAMDIFNAIFGGITALLIAVAAISLVVGGVGIMNIMYVIVTERTAEIGLKKALGAKNSDILSEFLIESVLVTILGGILGIILGAVLSWLLYIVATAYGLDWVFSVPLYAILIGVGVSAVIGISFGVLPARNAAKMDPIEALRYE
ncbi:MAG: ABC transporter permease [Candidatus Staskawiczbacteria bacterium]|nr:ABC transporter permease [Candidatus Staskawiczbacteria bacterium]